MRIEDLWKQLERHGVAVPVEVQRAVGMECNQERVLIRPPSTACHKIRVVEAGTTVPAAYVARQLGVTVRTVQRYRKLIAG